ncbi:citrate/2-methylcitrate synthase [Candidatus Pseudoscillospira sp. SGI.172]|uniref:citrate/2-methylcitrate synthase n=1 Tax=Candidatus Pseudoscillospira sp. SGI.172 TaxID=3420582 RepID=UPI0009BA3171|nr:citrate/2-methylcitrate synthase [Pseudoflavonifractor sp.]MDY3019761.1 citrate/2-methylcitrate synthase [Oscillospiraceae bacterium]
MQNEAAVPAGFLEGLCEEYRKNNQIDPSAYEKWEVKRGLRNADGTGVVAGVTEIANVRGYYIQDGDRVPMPGQLIYRGIDMTELIHGFTSEHRFGYAETAYLLLFGALPTKAQLEGFDAFMEANHDLPPMFTEDMILKAPSPDVMNKLGRAVLTLYSYDDNPEDMTLSSELRRAMILIARAPQIVAHAYAAKRHYYDNESLYLHRPQPGLSAAENFLWAVRHDNKFTPEEARLLDLCLVIHAEHGGGNNSAFACRVLSSTGTDLYSAVGAAVGSLKGPRHGGANKKVMEMFRYIEDGVKDWADEEEVSAYLGKLLSREAGDRTGLIYGMGHAIYTLSDPRAVILKKFARDLAESKGMLDEFRLYEAVERLTPQAMAAHGQRKVVCANVDLFSGFVYKMMGIPMELYTPLFAMARMVGWCAHRMEELYTPGGRIIRPAYKVVAPLRPFVPLEER